MDYQTLEDETVTIRERDSMDQQRVPIKQLSSQIRDKIALDKILESL
ncbi:MAG: His/Gly/Thr/Pro-type tRNA ligase C-terminal domain-containing protein [Bacteroidetes bacterium]|nr:His/Gly/Thr/Pro-type tRNA ligase C-terminal domain-containing protein [Bacteroidota bacterium]